MPHTSVTHDESWTLTVSRAAGDDWPDTPIPHTRSGAMYRPEFITCTVRRGFAFTFSVHGFRLKKDGTRSLNGFIDRYLRPGAEGTPQWAAGAVAQARAVHNLTDEALER